jgi:hypothetical protein
MNQRPYSPQSGTKAKILTAGPLTTKTSKTTKPVDVVIRQQSGTVGPILANHFSYADLSVPIWRPSQKPVSG